MGCTVNTETIKYARAVQGLPKSNTAFEGLSASFSPDQIRLWGEQEKIAMEKRGEHLRIYEVKSSNGNIPLLSHSCCIIV